MQPAANAASANIAQRNASALRADALPCHTASAATGAINGDDRLVHLVIHPLLHIARASNGDVIEVLDPSAELHSQPPRESWMQIEISAVSGAASTSWLRPLTVRRIEACVMLVVPAGALQNIAVQTRERRYRLRTYVQAPRRAANALPPPRP